MYQGYPPQQPSQGYPPQQGGFAGFAPAPQQGGYPPQHGGYGFPPQQGGFPPQQGGYPPQQGGFPPQQGGFPAQNFAPQGAPGFPTPAPAAPAGPLNWSDPVDLDLQTPASTPPDELKKLIARAYNEMAGQQSSDDSISSGNVDILNVVPKGQGCNVTFKVNDGQFPPDPQDRGFFGALLNGAGFGFGGAAGHAAFGRIFGGRRRRYGHGGGRGGYGGGRGRW